MLRKPTSLIDDVCGQFRMRVWIVAYAAVSLPHIESVEYVYVGGAHSKLLRSASTVMLFDYLRLVQTSRT